MEHPLHLHIVELRQTFWSTDHVEEKETEAGCGGTLKTERNGTKEGQEEIKEPGRNVRQALK